MTLVIYGPTATGKTALGIRLAKRLKGEIISADSRQVYRSLDIGTGKVSPEAKIEKHNGYWIVDGIKIHGFDLRDPGNNFTVADFVKFASDSMSRISGAGKLPIIVGGTGFYIKALLGGIGTIGIKPNLKLRKKLEKQSVGDLYQKLLNLDPKKANSMNDSDKKNPRRLIRAIDIAKSGYKPTTHNPLPTTHYLFIGLTAPNDYLYLRADQWIETRLSSGMIEEVENLLESKIDPIWLDGLGLEYRWLSRFLLGKIGKSEAIERLKGDIHNFIRRQKTWFKQFKEDQLGHRQVELFDISQSSWKENLENKVSLWYDVNE